MILIVGASGYLGRETTRLLLAAGHRTRLMVRTPAKVQALRAGRAELVQGDLTDTASLAAACAGVTAVFAAAHGLLGRGGQRSEAVDDEGHRQLIAAAKAADVRRFVYTSAMGAAADHPIDFWRTKWRIERALQASGIPCVILRPSAFMEQHVHEFNGQGLLNKGKAQLIGPGTKPRNFVAVRDVAQLAALALDDDTLLGRTLAIGGPDNLSNNDVAALYARLAGVPLRVSHLPAAVAGVMSRLIAPLHPGIARVLRLGSLGDDAFDERFDPTALRAAFPALRLTSVEDFVRERVQESRQH